MHTSSGYPGDSSGLNPNCLRRRPHGREHHKSVRYYPIALVPTSQSSRMGKRGVPRGAGSRDASRRDAIAEPGMQWTGEQGPGEKGPVEYPPHVGQVDACTCVGDRLQCPSWGEAGLPYGSVAAVG